MRKALKIARRVLLVFLAGILLIIIGLIINNRIIYGKYSSVNVDSSTLSVSELEDVADTYSYLSGHGNEIFKGFDQSIDLVVFNRKYEFLFTNKDYSGEWSYLGNDNATGKKIYSRAADSPQAFAVKVGDTWAGSFNTHDYFNLSILQQVPIFMPPQLFTYDKIGYRSLVIHEMMHAYQGKCDYDRVDKDEHIHNVCENLYSNTSFNRYIEQEGALLEEAAQLTDKSKIASQVYEFLSTRDKRRSECGISDADINNEQEFEWLEGCARYAEYISSNGSKSSISKSLSDISEKVKTRSEERYYALGMAEILVIKQLDIENWQHKLLYEGYTPEALLREYVKNK